MWRAFLRRRILILRARLERTSALCWACSRVFPVVWTQSEDHLLDKREILVRRYYSTSLQSGQVYISKATKDGKIKLHKTTLSVVYTVPLYITFNEFLRLCLGQWNHSAVQFFAGCYSSTQVRFKRNSIWSSFDFSFRSRGFEKSEIECWFAEKRQSTGICWGDFLIDVFGFLQDWCIFPVQVLR